MNKNLVWLVVLIVVAIIAFIIGRDTATAPQEQEKAAVAQAAKPTFEGAEKHEITMEEAEKYIQNYQNKMMPKGKAVTTFTKGGTVDRAIIDKILAQPGCQQLRFYYAIDDSGKQTIVIMGVDTSGRKMMPGIIGDRIRPCPPFCD
ncbi:MAG: hypothetical protein KBG83_01430 [Bacteroidetes bacterium]|nr:hypothetical protein [Bacteroidota bacterium]